jgi:NAD+ kinase
MKFPTVGIIARLNSPKAWQVSAQLIELLHQEGRRVVLDEISFQGFDLAHSPCEIAPRDTLAIQSDLILVVGGDGTLLHAARSVVNHHVPIMGINLGRLGFLIDLTSEQALEGLREVLDGHYVEEKRILLSVSIKRDMQRVYNEIAFNDVVIHKKDMTRMIEFEVFIDGHFVNSQRSDGLILATPTGSTAYALSAGGPIMYPSMDAFALVSVCPHAMSHRPLVIPANSVVELHGHENCRSNSVVSCDGQLQFNLEKGDKIRVARHGHPARLLHPVGHDYYATLRAKLHWGEKL